MSIKLKKTNNKRGFTLIELMVASAIFIIVMVIAIGAVLSIVDANRKAQSIQSVMTNLNFAVESMVRDMREGNNYCGVAGGCPGTDSISFKDSEGNSTTYNFDSTGGCGNVASGNGAICKTVTDTRTGDKTTSIMTAPEVHITSMFFSVYGNDVSDGYQPTILLLIKGVVGVNAKTQSTFQLQTLITQRLLDS